MRFAAAAFTILLALAGALPARTQVLNSDTEEFKRMAGELADLREANLAHLKRIAQMQREIDSLREAIRESNERSVSKLGDFATREDLKKIVDQIREVDNRRESDRKLILHEFESLGRTIAQSAKTPKRREPEPEPKASEPQKPIEGNFLEYPVQPSESLSEILKNYNAELQKQGRPAISMKQVLQANPGLNPNRIYAGQKLNLPVPDKN